MRSIAAAADEFCARLSAELQVLDSNERDALLADIDARDCAMVASGQERPVWLGPAPEVEILGRDVVLPTDLGDRAGRVICFGVVPSPERSELHERSVVVYVEASGTYVEAPGSSARLVVDSDRQKLAAESLMAARLSVAVNSALPKFETIAEKQEKQIVVKLLDRAKSSSNVAFVEEKRTGHKIVGKSGLRVYIVGNGSRIDLSGFTIDDPSVEQITAERAKEMHIGSVRGQLRTGDLSDDALLAIFDKILSSI